MTTLRTLPYRDATQLLDEISDVSQRADAFVKSVPIRADDVEICVHQEDGWGYGFQGREAVPLAPTKKRLTRARVFIDDKMGSSVVRGDTKEAWFQAIESACARMAPFREERPKAPVAAFPEPVTFDPQLANFACENRGIGELAGALLDNSWHEMERFRSQEQPTGRLIYQATRTTLARCRGVKTALAGHLDASIGFGRTFSERVIQVHCPESFLPLALMGARAFRNMPSAVADVSQLPIGRTIPLVIHPRVLEALLRTAGDRLFEPGANQLVPVGVKIASDQLTIVYDPHLDGLRFSRAFDDAGIATRRLPLVVNGRLTQRFSSGAPMNPLLGESGNRWYRTSSPKGLGTGFSSIVVDRGTNGFHELIGAQPQHVLINSLGPIEIDEDPTGHFCCPIESAVVINGNSPNEIVPPNALRFEGRLFGAPGGGPGLLSDVQVSRELHDTGSAILPYLVTKWRLRPND